MILQLLMIERMVIESLYYRSQSISELSKNLKLTRRETLTIIHKLVKDQFLAFSETERLVLAKKSLTNIDTIISTEKKLENSKAILNSMLENHYNSNCENSHFHLKQIILTQLELELLEEKTRDIQNFLEEISNKENAENLVHKKLILWSMTDYQDIGKNFSTKFKKIS